MHGLIIRPPWVDFILEGRKTWEIRGKRTSRRGRIALICSGSGHIVGTCDLFEVVGRLGPKRFEENLDHHRSERLVRFGSRYKTTYAWVIRNAQRLPEPVPYDHPQGAVVWVDLSEHPRCAELKEHCDAEKKTRGRKRAKAIPPLLRLPISAILEDSHSVDLSPDDPFHEVCKHFVREFGSGQEMTARRAVIAASCAYSWMATIPSFDMGVVEEAANTLARVSQGPDPCAFKLDKLRQFTNRSVVGMSKVLHFVAPKKYPILDGNVKDYLKVHGQRVDTDSVISYLEYTQACRIAAKTTEGRKTHAIVRDRLGRNVTAIRALELVMYSAGKEKG